MTPGDRVRAVIELLADDGTLLPIGSTGTVLGYEGSALVVEFEDHDTGETHTVTAEIWEVRK